MNIEDEQQLKDDIYKDIMEVMVKHANAPHQYWNPHFLAGVQDLLESYGNVEDETVNDWIHDMWGC